VHTGLLSLGLQPHYLTEEVLVEMLRLVSKYQHLINQELIFPKVTWG